VDVIDEIWSRAIGAQPPPTQGMVLLTAAVAACLVGYRPAWSRTRHAVTIAHEGAHGFVALLSGRRLSGIRLHSDTSGLTLSRGRPSGAGMVATAFAGYVGPALIGLAAAWVLATGHAVGLLWATLVYPAYYIVLTAWLSRRRRASDGGTRLPLPHSAISSKDVGYPSGASPPSLTRIPSARPRGR